MSRLAATMTAAAEPVGRDAADKRENQRRRDLSGEHVGQVGREW